MLRAPLLLLALASCVHAPVAKPATVSAVVPAAAAAPIFRRLVNGGAFHFDLWIPQHENLVPHSPLRLEWVDCAVRRGIEGDLKKLTCAPTKPAPELLDPGVRAGIERCYLVDDKPGSPAAVKAARQRYLSPDAKEETSQGVRTVVVEKTDTELTVLTYGAGGQLGPAPSCPADRPGCDFGMVAKSRERRAPTGMKVETQRSQPPPQISGAPVLPSPWERLVFHVVIPASGPEATPAKDQRFEVATLGRDAQVVADELASRLDAIDVAKEPPLVQEAWWLNRTLVAMLRGDRGALEGAHEGLKALTQVVGTQSAAGWAVSSVGKVVDWRLVFEDPCR